MPKEIVAHKPEEVNTITVRLRAANPSFLMYPTALFKAGSRFKWKARFLIGMGYLYALCFNGSTAKTTTEELKKVLSTNSDSRIYGLFDEIETLNRLAVVEAGGEHPDKFVRWIKGKRGRGGRTEVELVLPQDLSFIYPDNRFFPVPKIAFLLPVSAQAKALYLLLHYLKDKETNRATASTRSIARAISIDKASVGKLTEELVSRGVLSVKTSRKGTEFFVRSPVHWPDETLLEIAQTYSLSHPFLKEWSIALPENSPTRSHLSGKISNRRTPPKNSPIDGHQILQYTDTPPRNSPIDGHQKPEGSSEPKAQESLTTSKEKRITTSNTPTSINNGGGEFKNIQTFSNSEERVKEKESSQEESSPSNSASTAQEKKNRQEGAELGKPNKLAERIDRQELDKIKQVLSKISEAVKREARYCGIDVGKLDGALKEVYGELWWVPAAMYELLARKEGSGYNRKANYNPVGLLISFALKDSPASFWDMVRRFEELYGVKIPARRNSSPLLEPFYSYLDYLCEHKPATYRMLTKSLKEVVEEGGRVVVRFTDPATANVFEKLHGERMRELYGNNWKVEVA